jgi:periplasmic protein TonB
MIGFCEDTGKGRRSAAPFGLLMSLVIHLAFALVVMMAWKQARVMAPVEVTLVDTVRPASTAAPAKPIPAARPAPAPKPQVKKAPAEKSIAMPKPVPAARPLEVVKPEPAKAPAPAETAKPAPDMAGPPQEHAGEDVLPVHEPHIEAHGTMPAVKPVAVPANAASASAAASTGPAMQDIEAIERSYTDRLKELIERRIKYPVFARKARLEGTCMVTCRLMRTGEVLDIQIAKSTGHGLLDKAALKAVSDAGSFPPPPKALCNGELEVKVPVTFSLTGR